MKAQGRTRSVSLGVAAAILAAAFLFAPVIPAKAQDADPTLASLSAQIVALLEQVNALQAQLQVLREEQQTLQTELRDLIQLTRTLSLGATGEDVEDLQKLLASDPELYPEGLITGYFGPLTEEAVRRLQARFGIEQVGVVGPITRGTINELFGSLNRGKGSLNRGPGNIFDLIFADEDDLDDLEIIDLQYAPGAYRVLICQRRPGNSAALHTIAVAGPAVQAHVSRGSSLGRCDNDTDKDEDEDDENDKQTDEERAQDALDDAEEEIDDAEEKIDDAKDDGRDTDDAEELLVDAKDKLEDAQEEFDEDDFGDAEELAKEAGELAKDAKDAIDEDTAAPTISDIVATSTASTTATITWETDEEADSMVTYSTDNDVDTDTGSESESANVTDHSIELTGLDPDTEYFYIVSSEDPAGNTATSTIRSFTTSD